MRRRRKIKITELQKEKNQLKITHSTFMHQMMKSVYSLILILIQFIYLIDWVILMTIFTRGFG